MAGCTRPYSLVPWCLKLCTFSTDSLISAKDWISGEKKKKSFTVRVVKHTVFLENSLPREVVDASCLFKRNFANA